MVTSLTHPPPVLANCAARRCPSSQCQPGVRFRPRAQPNFATTHFSTGRGTRTKAARPSPKLAIPCRSPPTGRRRGRGRRGPTLTENSVERPETKERLAIQNLEPHVLQLLRRFLVNQHPCGWPGSNTHTHSQTFSSSSHQPLHTINTLLGPPSLTLPPSSFRRTSDLFFSNSFQDVIPPSCEIYSANPNCCSLR